MTVKSNNRGNGYIIPLTGKNAKKKEREKIVLSALSHCLHEYPGKSVNIVVTDNEILVNPVKTISYEEVNTTGKHRK